MKRLLCLDGGSSSLKFAAYDLSDDGAELSTVARGEVPAVADAGEALDAVLGRIDTAGAREIAAVGHRIVFGGARYVEPTIASDAVLEDLEAFVALEPLHLRAELDLVHAADQRLRGALQALCFDTAFHRRLPAIAKRLPLPQHLDPLIERYGFHGLSYEYVASQLPRNAGRTVIAHLGSGASLCALRDRMPLDTTMGFSPLGGLMMGTRPGDLDPGIVLRLLADGFDFDRLSDLFYGKSGLLGVSGQCAGMKELLERCAVESAAREAVDLFIYQLAKHLGAMVAVLGGLETLVFTGGIGENASTIRARACRPFEYLGVRLDARANGANDRKISTTESRVRVFVIPTDETLMIARHTGDLVRPQN
jgi:acetate kinase